MLFVYGLFTATAAIVAAEIKFDYSLGDVIHDFVLAVVARVKKLF